MSNIINELYGVINDRKVNKVADSYTSYLFTKGKDKILKKMGEEAIEVIIAAKSDDKNEQVEEFSDLIYHMLVLMNELDISVDDISQSLEKRRSKIGNLKKERADIEIL
ncbi:phosphoribosyl-ATP diphosphatase [uncultured Clostridium sp.]|uniref:phosphoribosyl-ATP diphosphatase n=1 Tax=uncultured Clostridium sp. TaxID=59620 RepID=UPI00260AB7FC|nr:phosphoribosyl-ATP diphosphatase [uncultured Clostridium sp.]